VKNSTQKVFVFNPCLVAKKKARNDAGFWLYSVQVLLNKSAVSSITDFLERVLMVVL